MRRRRLFEYWRSFAVALLLSIVLIGTLRDALPGLGLRWSWLIGFTPYYLWYLWVWWRRRAGDSGS